MIKELDWFGGTVFELFTVYQTLNVGRFIRIERIGDKLFVDNRIVIAIHHFSDERQRAIRYKQTTIWFANALNWLVTDTIRIFVLLTDLSQHTMVLSLSRSHSRQVITDLFQFDDIHVTDHDILFSPNFLTIQFGDLDWSLQWFEFFIDDRDVLCANTLTYI